MPANPLTPEPSFNQQRPIAGECMRVLVLLLAWTMVPAALAGNLADVEIYDRTNGSPSADPSPPRSSLCRGRAWTPIRNPHSQSTPEIASLAVTSVDGVNVITGETASEQQSGYVLTAQQNVAIEGWRKSLSDVATFYFTSLGDSYAARTGRPENVGVIGVALFRERRPCCSHWERSRRLRRRTECSARASRQYRAGGIANWVPATDHREHSAAQYVDFERASPSPDEMLVIHYDSRRNLIAARRPAT